MEIIIYLLFLLSGLTSFFTYRTGIKDGVRLQRNEEPLPMLSKNQGYTRSEEEKDFFSQYSKLMNYDFDKVGEADE